MDAGRSLGRIAALCVLLLGLAACQPRGGTTAAGPDEGEWPSQEEVVAEIDAVVERLEAGELSYEQGANSDEVIDALREVIPQPPNYPARSIEILIGFGEGGGSDNYTRNVGFDAERILGQTLVYNNMPGASGEVALGQLLTQAPDGYTIASAITNQVINDALDTQPYDFVDDVAFIIRQQGPTEIYWVRSDSQFETFEDMVAYAQENPGQVIVSGSGIGSDDEFRLLSLESQLDTEFGYVPFDGVGERTSAILSGDVDVLHETAGTVIDLYEDGQIRPLAYGGDIVFDRIDPDIPSVAELGYDVPIGRWRGMVTLGDVDQQIIDYLHNVFYASAQLPHYTEYEAEFFQDVAGGYLNSAEFKAEAARERDAVAQLAEEFDYSPDAR